MVRERFLGCKFKRSKVERKDVPEIKNTQILLKWLKLALKTHGFDTFTIVLVGIELVKLML